MGYMFNIFSCSVDCEKSTQGEEGLSVLSTTQVAQTMSGEQTGTCDSEHFKAFLYLFFSYEDHSCHQCNNFLPVSYYLITFVTLGSFITILIFIKFVSYPHYIFLLK